MELQNLNPRHAAAFNKALYCFFFYFTADLLTHLLFQLITDAFTLTNNILFHTFEEDGRVVNEY
jgi:hypothetical protein